MQFLPAMAGNGFYTTYKMVMTGWWFIMILFVE